MAISLARVYVDVRPDWSRFRAEFEAEVRRMGASTNGLEIKVSPRLDLTAFRAQWRVFAAVFLNRTHTITIRPVLHPSSTNLIINQLAEAGDRGGGAFGRVFSARMKAIIAAVAALVVGSLPLLSPLIQIFNSLVVAAGALGAALPLALAGITVGAATAITVFHNLDKAIKGAFSGTPTKDEQEAYDKLSTSAKTFVGILLDTRTKLKGFQEEIQEQFFKPFIVGFAELTKSPAIAILRQQMGELAAIAGKTGADIARAFANSAQSGQLTTILSGIKDLFSQISVVATPVTNMFLTLSAAALPFAQILTAQVIAGLLKLTNLVDQASKDGRLAQFFQDGLDTLIALKDLVVNVHSIIESFFGAITGGASTALGSLVAVTGQLADFLKTAEGQAILKTMADNFRLIGEVIQTVVAPLLPFLLHLSQTFSGPLREGIQQILPALGNFIDALVRGLEPVLKLLEPIFGQLITVIGNFIVLALREMTSHLDTLMPVLLQFVEKLGPQLGPLIEAFGNALIAMIPLIPTFTQFMLQLLPLLIQLTPVIILIVNIMAVMMTTFAKVIGWLVTLITWIVLLGQAWGKLGIAMEEVGQFFIRIWDAVVAWFTGKIVPSFMDALSDIGGFFAKLGQSIKQAFEDIKGWISSAWDFIKRVFDGMIKVVVEDIPNAFSRTVDAIGNAWSRVKELVAIPVRFVINTVVAKVVSVYNSIAGVLGATKLPDVSANFDTGGQTLSLPGRQTGQQGFARGGQLPGYSDVDNMVALGPDGKPLGLAGGEWVINAKQSRRHSGLLAAINSGMGGFAGGGIVGALGDLVGNVIDLFTSPAKFVGNQVAGLLDKIPGAGLTVNLVTRMGEKLIKGLIDWVTKSLASFGGAGAFGPWPSSPGAQRGDSGVWRAIVALINSTGPLSGSFGNSFRPGDPLWHGSGRAVDWMGFNQDALASFFMSRIGSVLELIHRSNSRDYAVTRGVNKGSFNNQLMQEHRNHIHIAMNEGGQLKTGNMLARIMDFGGILRPREIAANTSNRNELMLPEGMKISLSDDTIGRLADRIVAGFARVMGGGAMTALQIGRARA